MANKSSSVFGGPTTRWELGGNPNQTMFSKPQPVVAQTSEPAPTPAPQTTLTVDEFKENFTDLPGVVNETPANPPIPEELFLTHNALQEIQIISVDEYGAILYFNDGRSVGVSRAIGHKLMELLKSNGQHISE